ncbi:putative alpha-catenin [Operophtera brumata]|uniref:Vinculin n=1 Tax=Operophtera brumata TaxID=104452 RepID=A0A0L7LIX4_OPEBR|nr:putative alpha-catenin [Operophtera brumata]
MQKHTYLCEDAIRNNDSQKMVDNTSAIARLANRVLLVGGAERDNSEEDQFSAALGAALRRLQASIPPAVTCAKQVALSGAAHAPAWRHANAEIITSASEVESTLGHHHAPPPPPPLPEVLSRLRDNEIIAAAKRMAILMARLSELVRSDSKGSEEDQEATEMLVKETVKAAEGASIKIRTEQGGYRLRWVRRSPWYQI